MTIDVGQIGNFIQVTLAYSNAVVAAVLPHISDFAQKLDLPIQQPIAITNIVRCGILPFGGPGCVVGIKGGWNFTFRNGYVDSFLEDNTFAAIHIPDPIDPFTGSVNMTKDEVIEFARQTILKLGIPLEDVFAEQEPVVREPFEARTTNAIKTVPHYQIRWMDPRGDSNFMCSARIEIDGGRKRIEEIRFSNQNLDKPPPEIAVTPPPAHDNWPPVNMEYAKKLLPCVMASVDYYGKVMSLPIPCPLTTNHIKLFKVRENNGGIPLVGLELTNGWKFSYEGTRVKGYGAPDAFFTGFSPMLIKNFTNQWNMTEAQAIDLARKAIKKFDCDPSLFQFVNNKPKFIKKPFTTGKTVIPRYYFTWVYTVKIPQPTDGSRIIEDEEQVATAWAEVDAGTKTVKSVYFDHKSFWGHGPPIDVPITLPLKN